MIDTSINTHFCSIRYYNKIITAFNIKSIYKDKLSYTLFIHDDYIAAEFRLLIVVLTHNSIVNIKIDVRW